MNNIWTEKYSPISSRKIIGNKENINIIRNWIKSFKKNNQSKNGLIISGNTGIGKTLSANLLFKEADFDIIEYNAGDLRKLKNIRNKLSSIVSGVNIKMMISKNKITALIIDEIDTLTRGEKASIRQIKSFIENQFNFNKSSGINKLDSKKKNINPVICICNKINSSVKQLIPSCLLVEFKNPTYNEIKELILDICKNETISISKKIINTILENSQNDIRRVINILHVLKYHFIGKKDIKETDITLIINSFEKKDLNIGLYDAIYTLLTQKIPLEKMKHFYNVDKHLIPLFIHENSFKFIEKNMNITKKEKLKCIKKVLDYLIDSNIIEKNIRLNHNWYLDKYIGYLSCYPINLILNNNSKIRPAIYSNINNSPVFSKINYKFYNLKLMNNIIRKLNISLENFQDFTEILFNNLVLIDLKEDNYKNIFTLLHSKEITFKELDKSIKLSYLFEKHSKLYSRRKKKQLEILYNNFVK